MWWNDESEFRAGWQTPALAKALADHYSLKPTAFCLKMPVKAGLVYIIYRIFSENTFIFRCISELYGTLENVCL